MQQLAGDVMQKLRVVEDCLANYAIGTDNLHAAVEGLRDLLDSDKVFLYALGQRGVGDDLMVMREASVAPASARWRESFDDYIRGRGVSWGAYNALRPEPAQRDRVLRSDELAVLTQGKSAQVEKELYGRFGAQGEDTMRVLVCDGPSMLAWVGIIQPTATTERQRELFERVVPAFRRRLQFERLVAQSMMADSALLMALEEIPASAWLIVAQGKVEYANAAGRARLDSDRDAVREALLACTRAPGPSCDARFKVARIRDQQGSIAHMVVENAAPGAPNGSVGDAVRRLGLTPAQTRVFERVARGESNATIAAELGVAERTVEAHVTAILVKAQVSSRAALIVQIFNGHRATAAAP